MYVCHAAAARTAARTQVPIVTSDGTSHMCTPTRRRRSCGTRRASSGALATGSDSFVNSRVDMGASRHREDDGRKQDHVGGESEQGGMPDKPQQAETVG